MAQRKLAKIWVALTASSSMPLQPREFCNWLGRMEMKAAMTTLIVIAAMSASSYAAKGYDAVKHTGPVKKMPFTDFTIQ